MSRYGDAIIHIPIHHSWKQIVLIGGPNDGQELTVRMRRDTVIVGVTETREVDPQSVEKGTIYISTQQHDEEGRERFRCIGHHTTGQIEDLRRRGSAIGSDIEEHDPDDDWKQ